MTNPFMELISSGEGDYNSYNRGTSIGKNGKFTILGANQDIDFSQITIAEIRADSSYQSAKKIAYLPLENISSFRQI